MEKGIVKWFSDSKGYGFLEREGEKDIFVHYSGIVGDGKSRRALSDGDQVEFEVTDGPKGPQAVNVRVV